MTTNLPTRRPWLRLIVFFPLALLAAFAIMVAMVIAKFLVPAFGDLLDAVGDVVADNPSRLIGESVNTVVFGVLLGTLAFGVLATAALNWRRPLKDFLWPGRRFDSRLFGTGFLVMTAIATLWIPVELAMGSLWRPPVADPYYLDHTRVLYALAMAVGLLAAAAAEEVVFRGVLLRATGLLTRRAVLLCLINGLLFSAIHMDPDPVAFVARTISGMGYAWAALRLGGLEFGIGAHFANNLFIALIWAPMSHASQFRESQWIELAPQMITTTLVLIVVEWLARRPGAPASVLPARPAA